VALEKKCRIIASISTSRQMVEATCPPIIRDVGAIFVSYSSKIIAYALEHYEMKEKGNYCYNEAVYERLGLRRLFAVCPASRGLRFPPLRSKSIKFRRQVLPRHSSKAKLI
jgi:hypothetical protein